MKSNSQFFGVVLTATVITATTLLADDATKVNDLFPDPVIARGTGFEIKRSQLDDAIGAARANASAQGMQVTAADMPAITKSSLDHLLQVRLLMGKATDADKAKGKDEAEKRFDLISKRAASQEALARQLKSMNMTVEQLRTRLIEEATAEQVLRDKITVTDDEVKKFYDDNPSKFEQPEMIRANHILIATSDPKTGNPLSEEDTKAKKKIADDLLKRARAGEDFIKLAREYSEDLNAKSKLLLISDVVNLDALAGKFKTNGPPAALSKYISDQFSIVTRTLLSNYTGGMDLQLQQALTAELDQLISGAPLYNSNRFAGVKLSDATAKLLAQKPEDVDPVALNKALLFDAYPAELQDNSGGLIFPRHGRGIPLEFDAAAASLQDGQISDIVTTQLGYHIIKLEDKLPAKELAFVTVTNSIRNYLESAAMEKMIPSFFAQLKKEANVQILDDELKALEDAPSTQPSAADSVAAPAK